MYSDSVFEDLHFTHEEDGKLFVKAYCLNPPPDVCPPWGPCPNGDVTGIGQQVGVFATTIVYGLALLYFPDAQRGAFMAHLGIILALMLACLIVILRSQLTQNDGLFVLVSVASPPTIWLWISTIRSCWNPAAFPIAKEDPRNSKELHAFRVFSILSLFFFVGLILTMFLPNTSIKLSQPACNKDYGDHLWYNLIYIMPLAIQWASNVVCFVGVLLLCRAWVSRRTYEVPLRNPLERDGNLQDSNACSHEKPEGSQREPLDIVTWTERMLYAQYPHFMNRFLSTSIITVLQLGSLPTTLPYVESEDIIAWLLLTFGLFAGAPRGKIVVHYAVRFILWAFITAYIVVRALFVFIPGATDLVTMFLACTAAKWSWSNFTSKNMKFFVPIILVVVTAGLCVANVFIIMLGSAKSFSHGIANDPDEDMLSFVMVTITTVSGWFISWSATSIWPWRRFLSFRELVSASFARAHLLKLCLLLGPLMIWIQACISSEPTAIVDMTFGQVYALFVSVVTIIGLLEHIVQVPKRVWIAGIKSRRVPDAELPRATTW